MISSRRTSLSPARKKQRGQTTKVRQGRADEWVPQRAVGCIELNLLRHLDDRAAIGLKFKGLVCIQSPRERERCCDSAGRDFGTTISWSTEREACGVRPAPFESTSMMLFRRPLRTVEQISLEGGGQRGLGLCRQRPVLGTTS